MAELKIPLIHQVALREIFRLGLPVPRYLKDSEKSNTSPNPPDVSITYVTEDITFITQVKAFGEWVNGEYRLELRISKTYRVDIGWDYLHSESPYEVEAISFEIRYKNTVDKKRGPEKWSNWEEGPSLPIIPSFVAPISRAKKKSMFELLGDNQE